MKNALFLLLLTTSAWAQKDFAFDYIAEYDFRMVDSAKVQKRWFWFNSHDNSYRLEIIDTGRGNVRCYFFEINGKTSTFIMDKEQFFAGAACATNCKLVTDMFRDRYYHEEDYALTSVDTLVNGTPRNLFTAASKDPKREQRKKLGKACYIYGNQPEFDKPMIIPAIDYYLWKRDPKFPVGLPLDRYQLTFEGKRTFWYHLVDYAPLKVYFIIPKECAD